MRGRPINDQGSISVSNSRQVLARGLVNHGNLAVGIDNDEATAQVADGFLHFEQVVIQEGISEIFNAKKPLRASRPAKNALSQLSITRVGLGLDRQSHPIVEGFHAWRKIFECILYGQFRETVVDLLHS